MGIYVLIVLYINPLDPYYDLRENNLVCTSPIRDVKAFLHHSACCYNPLGTRNPSCFCYLLLHTYVPTYLLELCPKVIMWVNQGGNRSTLLLIYSSASGIPFLKSMYLEVQTWTTQQLSSTHPTIIILPTHPAFCPTVGWNTEKLCHLWIFSWN